MKKILLLCFSFVFVLSVWAQERVISGKVTSAEDGTGLPGVNVVLKGTAIGSVTDADGNYKISVPVQGGVLVFSFIGLTSQEATIDERSVLNVSLRSDIKELSEVVVVGYGTQLKQDLTGSIARVNGETVQNLPVTTFEQAIQGRAAGVQITAQNGKLGGGINIRIRGSSSISASNEPLYVVDGMIVNADNLSNNGSATNALVDLNFNDIESFQILKDASTAALYGSRGANGVVLITTKRGKAGKTSFTVNYQYGSSKPTGYREFLNSEQYIELFRESAYNRDIRSGYDPIGNPADYPDSWLEYAEQTMDYLAGHTDWRTNPVNTNWNDQAFQKANLSTFDFTASGGTDKTTFYFSGGYSDQDGILIGNSFKRTSGRMNIDHKASDKLSFGANVAISKTTNNRLSADNAFSTPLQLVALAPISPVRDENGELYDNALNPAHLYYPATVERENSHFVTDVFRNIVSLNATYLILPGLKIRGEYGFDLLTQQEDRYWNNKTQSGLPDAVNINGGYGSARWTQIFNYTTRIFATYDKTVGQHTFDVTGGYEYQQKTYDYASIAGQDFPVPELKKLSSSTQPLTASTGFEEETYLSFFGRLNYKFKDRYLLGLSARTDASSKFGPNNKYGFFPTASAGWILSQENFWSAVKPVSFLKLRASYGLTGNSGIPNYRYLAQYGTIAYGGASGLGASQTPNPDLSWETTAQFDVGFDFGLFNDKITGEIDYYNKQTRDLLLNAPIPATSGFTTQFRNVGDLENKGFEFVLNYNIVKTSDFSLTIGGNYAANRNKIIKLDGQQTRIDPASTRYINVVMLGQPIGTFYGPEYAGVDPANGNALWYRNDPDGDPNATTNVYAQAQKVVLGNPTPTSIYGFTLNTSYKGFDLNVLFQGIAGNKVYNAAGGFMSANMIYEDNQTIDQLRRWRQPGDITDVPQARLFQNNGASASSRFLEDGSYLRLKSVTLGYNLPRSVISKLSFSSARIYVSGQNLLTFTKYTGWDPEVNTDFLASNIFLSNDFYAAPQPKNLIVGVKLGF
ncbi:MAG: TonB-dependent receptor [Cyclobacteriaceae bacterium]|nr:TonB-dependent receptor [Cyclobacteriaceae bacterium]